MKQTLLSFFIVLASAMMPVVAHAQATISINPNIPGVYNVSTGGPCGWIVNFYSFSLIFAGILAFGAIVYGGFKYATSVGDPHKQGEGRAWIWSALLGLLLLGSAYVILYVVNPNLVKCSLPALSGVALSTGSPGAPGVGAGAPASTGGNCASGVCQNLPDCVSSSRVNCGGAQGMVDTLNCIQNQLQSSGQSFTVSEGYPPTVAHTSAGHNNGCSVDVVVPNSCAGVNALQAAATACGATSLNEYSGCPGSRVYGTTTGNNVHINAKQGAGGC